MNWRNAVFGWLGIMAPMSVIAAQVDISGYLEVEENYNEDYTGKTVNNIIVGALGLNFDATLRNVVTSHVSLLYEEGKTDFGIDEATITLGPSGGNGFTFGRMYVPFGRYETLMISDPQTLNLGQAMENVFMLSLEKEDSYGSVYIFNGNSKESATVAAGNDDTISGGFVWGRRRGDSLDFSVSYITNIGDSNMLQELGAVTPGQVHTGVQGTSAHLKVKSGNVIFIVEQIMALDKFANGDLGGTVANTEKPSATNIEMGFINKGGSIFALGYQTTDDAQFIGLPKTVSSVSMRKEFIPGASIGLEYVQAEDYKAAVGGSGATSNSTILQVKMTF